MTSAERSAAFALAHPQPALEIVGRVWIALEEPELHLALNDGSSVLIRWDLDYQHRLLFVASPGEDFITCTADQTGLSEDELAPLVDEVHRAALMHEAERLSDEDGADYAMDSAEARR